MNHIQNDRPLSGQFAIVTGASGGIGAACAQSLAEAGACVGVHYHSDQSSALKVKKLCEDLGVEAEVFKADVSIVEEVARMFDSFIERFGFLDILVANAGMQIDKSFTELSAGDWNTVMGVNLSGQFFCAQRAAKQFLRQGVRKGISRSAGKIIHMSSVHQRIPWPGHCNYAASKGGVKLLMESAALELAPHKIRVNAIAPGAIKTDINEDVWSDDAQLKKLLEIIPYERLGEAREVGNALRYLCSDKADYVTGTTLFIDGGMSLYPSFLNNG